MESCDEKGNAICSLRNKFATGDVLEAVGPDTRPFPFTAEGMADEAGVPLDEPRTPQMKFSIRLPQPVPAYTILRKSVDLSAK